MVKEIDWTVSAMSNMPSVLLHDILQLRSEIFVVEQKCIFMDVDGIDPIALHLCGHHQGRLLAYARCIPPDVESLEAVIGRIVVRLEIRGRGLGHALVSRAVQVVRENWGDVGIRIGAQIRLKKFYESHGFLDLQEPYDEDGIGHIKMLRHSQNTNEVDAKC